jgi:hypothetical protein
MADVAFPIGRLGQRAAERRVKEDGIVAEPT